MIVRILKISAIVLCVAVGWFYISNLPRLPTHKNVELSLEEKLGRSPSQRYRAHVSVDKHIYRPGDRVQSHALVLDVFDHKPLTAADCASMAYYQTTAEVIGPSGSVIFTERAIHWNQQHCNTSTITTSWSIPLFTPGGDYTIRYSSTHAWIARGERKFQIREYSPPRLNGNIEFQSKMYGPGEYVMAVLEVEKVEGGVPANAQIEFRATLNNQIVVSDTQKLDPSGKNLLKFQLPAFGVVSQALLVATVRAGGVVETFSKTIPVVLNQLQIELFPEGGDLVEGVMNVVYFQASFPNKDPADMFGALCKMEGQICNPVTSVRTEHEGRGKFEFHHEIGAKYAIQVHQPTRISELTHLTSAKAAYGTAHIAFITPQSVVKTGGVLQASLSSTQAYSGLSAVLSRNERVMIHQQIASGTTSIQFPIPRNFSSGVYTLTLLHYALPIAERLVFVQPSGKIFFEVKPMDHEGSLVYTPGSTVRLGVSAKDENGNPVPAVFSVKVVDKSVSRKLEPRLRHPRMSDMVLLENEVAALFDSGSYLSQNEENIDLLLGVQGWRRYAYGNISAFIQKYDQLALRSLGANSHLLSPQYEQVPIPFNRFLNMLIDVFGMPQARFYSLIEPDMRAQRQEMFRQRHMVPDKMAEDFAERDDLEVGRAAPFAHFAMQPPPGPRPTEPPKQNNRATPAPGRHHPKTKANTQSTQQPQQRDNFQEVVFYKHAGRLDTAATSFEFRLSDSITIFEVMVDGYSTETSQLQGVLFGENTTEIRSVKPFYAEVKLPVEVSSGDRVTVPVTLFNSKPSSVNAVFTFDISECNLEVDKKHETVSIPPMSSVRTLVTLSPKNEKLIQSKTEKINVNVVAYIDKSEERDAVTRHFRIVPKGFPQAQFAAGMLQYSPDQKDDTLGIKTHDFALPPTTMPGSVVAKLNIIQSPADQLNKSLTALIREPYGCFEQTSSTTYPLVMAYQYMKDHHTDFTSETMKNAYDMIDRGYKRLLGFECKCSSSTCGFEWFGRAPGHEALTAYGLMEFIDMSKVYPVEQQVITRTKDWLLGRLAQDQKSFLRSSAAIDDFGRAPGSVTDAYIVWALAATNVIDSASVILTEQRAQAETSDDPYQIGLIANALFSTNQREEGLKFARRLLSFVDEKDGSVHRAKTSITSSRGEPLLVETTSIAVLAWLNDPSFKLQAIEGVKWLLSKSKEGKFGSTQGTILALKALLAFDDQTSKSTGGTIEFFVDGKAVPIEKSTVDFSHLISGKHTISLSLKSSSQEAVSMGYMVSVEYKAVSLQTANDVPIKLETSIKDPVMKEGQVTNVNVVLTNTEDNSQGMVVAIVGMPAGLEPRFEYLQELVKNEKIAFFEIMGREVVLYWRGFAASARMEFVLEATATILGYYMGPASRAYLYYDDEVKSWNDPLAVQII